MKYLRLFTKIISRLFFFVAAIAMLLAFLIATNAGSALLLSTASLFIPGKVKFASVDGDLHSGLLIHNITYAHGDIHTKIESVSFKINSFHLLQQQMNAESYIKRASLEFISGSSSDSASLALQFNARLAQNPWVSLAIKDISGELQHNRLSGGASITYDSGNIIIPASHLMIGSASADISGIATQQFDIHWWVSAPNLAIFYNSAGSIALKGSIKGSRLNPTILANVDGNNIRLPHLRMKKISGEMSANVINSNEFTAQTKLQTLNAIADTYRIPDLQLQMTNLYKHAALSTNLNISSNKSMRLTSKILFPECHSFTDLNQKVDARVDLVVARLSDLPIAIPTTSHLAGSLNAKLALNGTISKPQMVLDATLQNGGVQIPVIGLHLQQIILSANARLNQPIAFNGQFQSGKGKGTVTGSYDLFKDKPVLNLKLSGKQLQILNTAEYKVSASPDIVLTTDGEHIDIVGSTTVPYAKLSSASHQAAASLPDDVVFVHNQTPTVSVLDHLSLQLKISLGEEVNFSDDTMQAQLKGGLQLSKQDKGEITAIGDLNVLNGKFNAYGQKLVIKVGRLLYTGNLLLNPGLDIVAAKEVGTKTVGAKVRGTLKSPLLTLYSDPAGLSQVDILSYLVFGVPRAQVSAFNAITLLNYLSMGKSKGGQPIKKFTDSLQKTFGLTDIDVAQVDYFDPTTNTNGNTTAMSVGKKIGKKLSLHYSVGLFKPISVFNVRYQLLKKIYVQAESSPVENGADLFYEVEFD